MGQTIPRKAGALEPGQQPVMLRFTCGEVTGQDIRTDTHGVLDSKVTRS